MSSRSSIAHYGSRPSLGEGGMGTVYRATDIKLGRDVAIKYSAVACFMANQAYRTKSRVMWDKKWDLPA